MSTDNRRLVAAGYDEIADAYLERLGVSVVRQRWIDRLSAYLPADGGQVLDLGCVSAVSALETI